ncbi:hypothetical protein DXX93_11050 [Thalassotalea euphylliae]|uniref:Uncharacterized protein n=1 Tax=Thalassotalea euphylliae TaxID=1655234 RepID=A0A3E0TSY9_9GAMM|nr:hypothetical protein [Thalassotalea euphylliae]REL27045.1 hypothetical protein DXX93_11050 [Thalassotalea euphylliae]
MESVALIKTIALIGLYALPILLLIISFFSHRKMKSWEYIFLSVSLLVCASVILVTVHKMQMMSDDIVAQNYDLKLNQLEKSNGQIKQNQGVIKRLIENGETEEKIIYELGPLKELLDKQETEDLSYFKSWLFVFEVISALFAIPLSVNFFVHGVTTRHQTTSVYEIPVEIYSRLGKLESSVAILAAANIVLIIVVIVSMIS